MSDDVRVRRAERGEAFLLGALHLQSLTARGLRAQPRLDEGAPSHVESFARAWEAHHELLPAWVAERAGEHVGMAVVQRQALPVVGDGIPVLLDLYALEQEGRSTVTLALIRTLVAWAGEQGAPGLRVGLGVELGAGVLNAAAAIVKRPNSYLLPLR